MKPEPVFAGVESVRERFGPGKAVLLSPQGETLSSALARRLSDDRARHRPRGEPEQVVRHVVEEHAHVRRSLRVPHGGEQGGASIARAARPATAQCGLSRPLPGP